jgi:hypothetical protein
MLDNNLFSKFHVKKIQNILKGFLNFHHKIVFGNIFVW